MTYVTANPHGENERFQTLLRAIDFCDSDVLYVLGDIVDYGEGAMDLLTDMSMRLNVFPIAGEHDFTALKMLTGFSKMLESGKAPDADFSAKMTEWAADGGMATLNAFRALDADMREGALDYLADCMLCDEVEVKGKRYFLAHAGLDHYSADKLSEDYTPEEVFAPVLPDKSFFKDRTLVVGHTPTASGKIERRDGVIYLDCGAGRGGRLGCLCLETGEEYYA